jgi:hypothetical protein
MRHRACCRDDADLLDSVPTLPGLDSSLLVRTDFASDDAWQELSDEAQQESQDGFRAYLVPVSDPALDHLDWETVRAALPVGDHGALVLFIADSTTRNSPDHPVLAVDLSRDAGDRPFRCIPSELCSVENNLNLANMDWEDFAGAVDDDGGGLAGLYQNLRCPGWQDEVAALGQDQGMCVYLLLFTAGGRPVARASRWPESLGRARRVATARNPAAAMFSSA